MLKIKTTGFDKLTRSLKRMEDNARALDGKHEVPMDELMTPEFMREHTDFDSFDALLEASPFTVETAEDFKQIPDDEWDRYIDSVTSFPSWEKMMGAAAAEYAGRQLMDGV